MRGHAGRLPLSWPSHRMGTILAAGFVTAVLYAINHRAGIGLEPDGWASWQGAVSINDGLGYRYFSGNEIVAWPPLYSFYLAAWISLLGPTGLGLIIANGVLITAQSMVWVWLVAKLADQGDGKTQ